MEQLQQTKNICISDCMVSDLGGEFRDIIPGKVGRWNPGYIYVVKHINDVLSVKVNLEEGVLA